MMAISGFFVDPSETTRLTFAEDCVVEKLRGQWLDVRTVLDSSELDDLDLGGLESVGEDKKGRQVFELDMRQSISKRVKKWVVRWSFVNDRGAQTKATFLQIQKLHPAVRREILVLLDAHEKLARGREEVAEYDETPGVPLVESSTDGQAEPETGAASSPTLALADSGSG